MIIDEDAYLEHYGILRKSGRYPWGSGQDQHQKNRMFLDYVEGLARQGLSQTEIARGLSTEDYPVTTTMLREAKTIAKAEQKQSNIAMAQRLKDRGYGSTAIGERMGLSESTVRALLAPGQKERADNLQAVSDMLKRSVEDKKYIDVGAGVNNHLDISKEKLATAVANLREEGYTLHYVKVPQLGTTHDTTMKVLAAPGVGYSEVYRNRDQIQQIREYSHDGGRTFLGIHPPLPVDPKRVAIRYAEEGGKDADGVVYVRPGVSDLSLGGNSYAQVRINVGGTHYIKGMAMYKDDLPDGVDLQFNTNKSNTGNKLDALKPLKDDPDNPFGAVVNQITTRDASGKEHVTSAMNLVNDEGEWGQWNKSIASQVLSKQAPLLAKQQLQLTYAQKKDTLDEINRLTNPAVKKKLLEDFADSADSAAANLKAAALPRQATQVILPINSMKETEVYAPNFEHGERVVLIRYPHGGIFEIPELVVNNNHREAKSLLDNAKDAVGINSKVAQKLSGADFDGDFVLVIPNNQGRIKTAPALAGLKDFDHIASYHDPSLPKMSPDTKQMQMGSISNLITDMTIQRANASELARAVRHSMVVIDAEKHDLDYKRSARDNGIQALKQKYQTASAKGGASTLISRATSEARPLERKPRPAAQGGPIDKATGQKMFVNTGASYVNAKGQTVFRTIKSTKLKETTDAHTLSSGTVIEKIYADHSNRLKALANEARKEAVNIKSVPASPSAKVAYNKQVSTLDAKLRLAERSAPLERQAQVLANAVLSAKKRANPEMEAADIKKIKFQALAEMRNRVNPGGKPRIEIDEEEWAAIQAGAISNNKLTRILKHADMDVVKKLATPRTTLLMTPAKRQRAKAMLASGFTQADIARALGVSLSTLKTSIGG